MIRNGCSYLMYNDPTSTSFLLLPKVEISLGMNTFYELNK